MSRSVIVTGGTGGVGVSVTERLRRDGWRVVVPWVAERELERLPDRDAVTLVQADLFDADAARAAVDTAASDPQAPLRAVVNLVGGFAMGGRVQDTPIEDFEHMLRLNLRPTYLVTAAALPHMVAAGGGSVVCISSRSALEPLATGAGYTAAKAAVIAFARTVALEYAGDGVRANAILPSMIGTAANRAEMPDAKMVPPEDIAELIAFLVSDASRSTSGAAIPIYG